MSRFADPSAVERIELGACDCLGKPHGTAKDADWAVIRTDYSASEVATILSILNGASEEEAAIKVAPFILEWNLLDPHGHPWQPDAEAIRLLKGPTLTPIAEALGRNLEKNLTLPKRSGSPSRASRAGRASAAPTPIRSRGTSTSPSAPAGRLT